MASLQELTSIITRFRDERDWKQFHTFKDMVLSLMIETGELAEHFQWKDQNATKDELDAKRESISEELADVLYWVLLISHDLGVDMEAAFLSKMEKNRKKYPAEKFAGRSDKYDRL